MHGQIIMMVKFYYVSITFFCFIILEKGFAAKRRKKMVRIEIIITVNVRG